MLKYISVANSLKEYIEHSNLKQGDRLPNVLTLADDYNTSKTTIVKALEILKADGLIYQVQGSGNYARLPKRTGYINFQSNLGFTTNLHEENLSSQSVSVTSIAADTELAEQLQCAIGTPIYHVERTRTMDGKILCLENSFFNANLIKYLNQEIAEGSIFKYLTDVLDISIGFSDKFFKVRELTNYEAGKLALTAGQPTLDAHEVFFTNDGIPFDYSSNVYHFENADFYLQTQQK